MRAGSAAARRGGVATAFALDRRAVWRWHFYAGLLCVPLVCMLALTGAVYLFKPELDAWEDARIEGVSPSTGAAVSADAQVSAALSLFPNARFTAYELPPREGAAARVLLHGAGGDPLRVFVAADGTVLGSLNDDARIAQIAKTIHGELLLGEAGSLLVELAACWAIVMIFTGLWLWWPRGRRDGAGVWWPRLRATVQGRSSRVVVRDLHAVTGAWISLLALFLLVTGLPWATVWGAALKEVREATGTTGARQDWTFSRAQEKREAAGEHAEHVIHAGHVNTAALPAGASLQSIVLAVTPLDLAPPVVIRAPRDGEWDVQSQSQNRTLRVTLRYDEATGVLRSREDFAQRHVIDRAIGIGVAAHEGHLFGWPNRLLMLATALGLVLLCVTAVVMWRVRKPTGVLGAPPMAVARDVRVPWAIVVVLGVLMPVLGASLVLLWLFDRAVLPRWPSAAQWLGLVGDGGAPASDPAPG